MPSNPQTLPACRTPACTTLQRAPCLGPALARRPPCSPWDALWCFITAVPDPPMDLLRCASLLTAAATAAASHTLRHAQLRLQQPSPRGTSGLLHTLYVHRTYGAYHMAIRAMCDLCVHRDMPAHYWSLGDLYTVAVLTLRKTYRYIAIHVEASGLEGLADAPHVWQDLKSATLVVARWLPTDHLRAQPLLSSRPPPQACCTSHALVWRFLAPPSCPSLRRLFMCLSPPTPTASVAGLL